MISRLERSKKIEKEIKKENRLEKKELRKKRNKKLLSFLLGITLIFFIYSCFIEPNFIIVNEKVILNNNIKEEIEKAKGGNKESTNAENVLAIIAYLTLIAGVMIFIAFVYEDTALAFGILISSIVTWGVLIVLCNISNNLHEINKKMN